MGSQEITELPAVSHLEAENPQLLEEKGSLKILKDIVAKEKDLDRMIMCNIYTEYCKSATNGQCQRGEQCMKVHYNQKESCLRRPPFSPDFSHINYLPIMCSLAPNSHDIQSCYYAHSNEEIQYHPTTYKTQLCLKKMECQMRLVCPYAHQDSELRKAHIYHQFHHQKNKDGAQDITTQPSFQTYSNEEFEIKNKTSSIGKKNIAQQQVLPQKTTSTTSQVNSLTSEGIRYLDLHNFKVNRCQVMAQHNPKKCFNYHESKKEKRRPLGLYCSEPCPYIKNTEQGCPMGDSCPKSHNRVEEFYHPEKYKSKFCSSFPHNTQGCDYGEMCAFAHSEDELSVDLIDKYEKDIDFYLFHFKTVWCPYNETNHSRDECVYAHNWQDLRRKPQQFDYATEICPDWDSRNFIQSYSQGCKLEYRCSYSHGWKEQEYHPYIYKTKLCKLGVTCSKMHCPFFHNEQDYRKTNTEHFKLVPKKRFSQMHNSVSYKPVFLNLLFNMPSRVSQTFIDQATGMQMQTFTSQNIYGCSPQSSPVLDPSIVFAFQQYLMKNQHNGIINNSTFSHIQKGIPSFMEVHQDFSQTQFHQQQQLINQMYYQTQQQQPLYNKQNHSNENIQQIVQRPQTHGLNPQASVYKRQSVEQLPKSQKNEQQLTYKNYKDKSSYQALNVPPPGLEFMRPDIPQCSNQNQQLTNSQFQKSNCLPHQPYIDLKGQQLHFSYDPRFNQKISKETSSMPNLIPSVKQRCSNDNLEYLSEKLQFSLQKSSDPSNLDQIQTTHSTLNLASSSFIKPRSLLQDKLLSEVGSQQAIHNKSQKSNKKTAGDDNEGEPLYVNLGSLSDLNEDEDGEAEAEEDYRNIEYLIQQSNIEFKKSQNRFESSNVDEQ